MDFDNAVNRLKKDQASFRSKTRNHRNKSLASSSQAAKQKKMEEYRRKQMETRRKEELKKKKIEGFGKNVILKFERRLGIVPDILVKNNVVVDTVDTITTEGSTNATQNSSTIPPNPSSSSSTSTSTSTTTLLKAASVHGQGDKINLPTSILSTLAEKSLLHQENGQPLFFRLGIPRDNYIFPASPAMKKVLEDYSHDQDRKYQEETQDMEHDDDDDDDEEEDDSDDESQTKLHLQAYMEEMNYKYYSYAYATVIEFTQDEGMIGIPSSIASSLLHIQKPLDCDGGLTELEGVITLDPAMKSLSANSGGTSTDVDAMDIDEVDGTTTTPTLPTTTTTSPQDATPGHIAYNSFKVPKLPIEVVLLKNLPLGTNCTFQPTSQSIQNGFHQIKNIKLTLEQSLIRTRGCLNRGDVVETWFRGKKFELVVKSVTPEEFGAVSCVNTDVEVDFVSCPTDGEDEAKDEGKNNTNDNEKKDATMNQGRTLGGTITNPPRTTTNSTNTANTNTNVFSNNEGRRLVNTNETTSSSSSESFQQWKDLFHKSGDAATTNITTIHSLPPIPPNDQKQNVVQIQLQGMAKRSQRRKFDTNGTTLLDLFRFAIVEGVVPTNQGGNNDGEVIPFRLVSRHPRRIFTSEDGSMNLEELGLVGSELLIVEPC